MVFRARNSVSASSCRAISRIASLAILQTIALPTELPRRCLHFTRKLARESTSARQMVRPLCGAAHAIVCAPTHDHAETIGVDGRHKAPRQWLLPDHGACEEPMNAVPRRRATDQGGG